MVWDDTYLRDIAFHQPTHKKKDFENNKYLNNSRLQLNTTSSIHMPKSITTQYRDHHQQQKLLQFEQHHRNNSIDIFADNFFVCWFIAKIYRTF